MQIRSKQSANKYDVIVLDDNKKYLVKECRKLVPHLGEPKGFLLTLEEINEWCKFYKNKESTWEC